MDSFVLQCIQVRTDFFDKYYSIPGDVQADVDAFILRMHALGEQSETPQDFETSFAANGLQEQFNALLMRCTPVSHQMTKEEKAVVKQTAKELFKEDRSRILKEAAQDALDYASVMAEEELIARKRKAMIDADVFDDYTRGTNAVDMAKDVGSLFKHLFKKKK